MRPIVSLLYSWLQPEHVHPALWAVELWEHFKVPLGSPFSTAFMSCCSSRGLANMRPMLVSFSAVEGSSLRQCSQNMLCSRRPCTAPCHEGVLTVLGKTAGHTAKDWKTKLYSPSVLNTAPCQLGHTGTQSHIAQMVSMGLSSVPDTQACLPPAQYGL